jgi:hypothetical protein
MSGSEGGNVYQPARLASASLLAAVATLVPLAGTADAGPGNQDDFVGTNVNIHGSIGGPVIGKGNQGDGATWLEADPGPAVTCPDGHVDTGRNLVKDNRTGVTGYVSNCFLA